MHIEADDPVMGDEFDQAGGLVLDRGDDHMTPRAHRGREPIPMTGQGGCMMYIGKPIYLKFLTCAGACATALTTGQGCVAVAGEANAVIGIILRKEETAWPTV